MKRIWALLPCIIFFLFAGCSSSVQIDLASAVENVYSSQLDPLNENWLTSAGTDKTAELLGIDNSLLEEACFYYSSSATNATAVGGFRIKAENKENILQVLKEYQRRTSEKFYGFLPDQYQITQTAECLEYGDIIFFLMTDCNSKIEEEIEQILSKQ